MSDMKTKRRRRIPTRIRELRERGVVLSQEQIGKLLDPPVDGTAVSRHETGERSLSREQALQYAAIFHVPSHELFFSTEEPAAAE